MTATPALMRMKPPEPDPLVLKWLYSIVATSTKLYCEPRLPIDDPGSPWLDH